MHSSVKDLFEAESKNIVSLANRTQEGFVIPEYQRPYDWDSAKVMRLFTDCLRGFYRMQQGKGTNGYCFLGSLILVSEPNREKSFNGSTISVVDGQQRLTTLALLSAALFEVIRNLEILKIPNLSQPVYIWLESEKSGILDDLMGMCLGSMKVGGNKLSFFPKIVRAKFNDNRADDPRESEYISPIAKFLEAFSKVAPDHKDFIVPSINKNRAGVQVTQNFSLLKECCENISNHEAYDDYDASILLKTEASRSQYRTLWRRLESHFPNQENENSTVTSIGKNEDRFSSIRLLLFGLYFVERVVVTCVTPRDEELAFDIFDALNTTGEPLTALETLKPVVIKFEKSIKLKNHVKSDSKSNFDRIEAVLDKKQLSTTQKQNLTRDALVNAALLLNGDKIGRDMSEQRTKLRRLFDEASNSGPSHATRFVRGIKDVFVFRNAYWDSDLDNLGSYHKSTEVDEIQFHFSVIRGLKTHLALPLLQSFWSEDLKSTGDDTFLPALRSTVAFLLLRRGFTGSTAGIDSIFRKLMNTNMESNPAAAARFLKIGVSSEFEKPTLEQYKSELLRQLNTKGRYGFTTKAEWVNKVYTNPLYSHSTTLCKAILLFANEGSRPDKTSSSGCLKREGIRKSRALSFTKFDSWIDKNHATVEHIAPQSPKRKQDWDTIIYDTPGMVDSIGNLTLLPVALNQHIGNASWPKKGKFFKAIACKEDEKQKPYFDEASAQGIYFGKDFKDLIRSGDHLPLCESIAEVPNWDADVIKIRSKNVANLAYDKLIEWL